MSLQKYQAAQRATESPRSTEYRLFAQVTRALMDYKEGPGPKRIEALDWNRHVWTVLLSDLADSRNQLPSQLKATLISLSIWVGKYTRKVMSGRAPLQPLIDVNRNVMEGLAAGARNALAQPQNRNAA
ncbi:MAG TPA: flagellar biosynthesis regulator FlaF [Candidatus Sulfotelmatobacter sp.]|nr:flagellar biosynthesis regulator FlaF [Candidatus Sulfotelmatobacter sp.]